MKLEELIGQRVRVKDRKIVGKKHFATLLAVSHDGSIGYLRLTKNRFKIEAHPHEISAMPFGLELAKRSPC